MNISRSLSLLLLCSGLPMVAAAASTPATHEFMLENGLKIIVREDHRSPAVTSQLWFKVGSSYEPPGQSGLSHALEHMLYRGSSKACSGEFSAILQKLGAWENAVTGTDYTYYYQTLPAGRLGVALEMMADMMSTAHLDPEIFTTELRVIQEERHQTSTPGSDELTNIAFPASGYRTPIIGWEHDLKRMTANQLKAWYQAWYAPNNATLVIVGDVVAEQAKELAQRYFSHLDRRVVPESPVPLELAEPGERAVTLNAPVAATRVIMSFNTPSLTTVQDRRTAHALRLLDVLLAGSYSSRITQKLQFGDPVFSSVDSNYALLSRGDSSLTIKLQLNTKHTNSLDEALDRLWQVIDELKTTPPQTSELERAKTILIARQVYTQDSLEDQASTLGMLETIGLPWRLADQDIDELKKVTAHDIQQVASTFLTRERLSIARILPEKKNG